MNGVMYIEDEPSFSQSLSGAQLHGGEVSSCGAALTCQCDHSVRYNGEQWIIMKFSHTVRTYSTPIQIKADSPAVKLLFTEPGTLLA